MRFAVAACCLLFAFPRLAVAAGGVLNVSVLDEHSGQPTITRVEITRAAAPDKPLPIRKAVPAGVGVVLDRTLELSLPDGGYQFRMIRGPEYRIVSGTFALERTSLDDHRTELPRMVDMLAEGWTSGDCCVVPSADSLPLRMAAEDLHLAAVLGDVEAKPIPGRDRDDPPQNDPSWISTTAVCHDGLLFYHDAPAGETDAPADEENGQPLPSERLAAMGSRDDIRVAIEDPFAWPLPVWLASGRIDGFFVLGDWLRLDRKILNVKEGRGPHSVSGVAIAGDEQAVGRWAERIYWNLLEAGLRIAPLAGSGDEGKTTPVGYNRLYVADPLEEYEQDGQLEARPVASAQRWWQAAWQGQSVATNGPCLRPKLGGKIPGHVFQGTTGEVLQLQPELMLAVRDPVEYLEVIHNGRVHYSARLDEFAKAGGLIPPIMAKQSGWVTIRVVTLFEDHFRAAMSAPWYIEFDSRPRVTADSVAFFRTWLSDYEDRLKRMPAEELSRHVPFVRSARSFWEARAALATE